jgi:hypothetical protein
MNGVAMNKRAAPAAARCKAVGSAKGPIQPFFSPILCCDFSHDLLRHHIERLMQDRDSVEFAADAVEQGGAFQKITAR